MRSSHRFLLLAAGGAGLVAGIAGRRSMDGGGQEGPAAPTVESHEPPKASGHISGRAVIDSAEAERVLGEARQMKSSDTLEDLLALDDIEFYGRAALWLADAPLDRIEACWEAIKDSDEHSMWSRDLVMARWTRLDPLAAVRATEGTNRAKVAWWAWAMNDPEIALARVMEMAPDKRGFVMRALSQYHPERAIELFETRPELQSSGAVEGIARHMARDDPEAGMDFLKKHGQTYQTEQLDDWLRDDPQAAFEWVLRQGRGHAGQNYLKSAIKRLAVENPEALAELAAGQPGGRVRREMEDELFRIQLESDPEAAIEQARKAEAPRVVAERLALAAKELAATEPERSLELFSELLGTFPNATDHRLMTRYPNGSSSSGGELPQVGELIRTLMSIDPRRALEIEIAATASRADETGHHDPHGHGVPAVAQYWARRDVDAYADWLDEQPDEQMREKSVGLMTSSLEREERFAEAIEWAESVTDQSSRESMLNNLFYSWASHDEDAAAAWLEEAELSDSSRVRLQRYLTPGEK